VTLCCCFFAIFIIWLVLLISVPFKRLFVLEKTNIKQFPCLMRRIEYNYVRRKFFFGFTFLGLKHWNIKILQKNEFVENVSALFIYVSTHCVETVKSLNNNRYFQLTCNPDVMHPTGVREVPGLIPGSGKDFYVWFSVFFLCLTFCFVVVVVVVDVVVVVFLLFLSKTDYLSRNFAMLIHLEYTGT